MSSRKAYIVFRCPNCGFYSLASPKQRTRLCVRCGKTVTIEDSYARIAKNFEEAQRLVGELNSKRGSEKPGESGQLQSISAKGEKIVDPTKTGNKGLLKAFQEVLLRYANEEVELTEFLRECEIHGIPRGYAQKLIGKLVDSGQAYRPEKDRIRLL